MRFHYIVGGGVTSAPRRGRRGTGRGWGSARAITPRTRLTPGRYRRAASAQKRRRSRKTRSPRPEPPHPHSDRSTGSHDLLGVPGLGDGAVPDGGEVLPAGQRQVHPERPAAQEHTQPQPVRVRGLQPGQRYDPTGLKYCDVGLSLGNGFFGFVGGFILSEGDIHPYFGSGVVSPGPGAAFTCSTNDPTLGWNAGGGGSWGVGAQYGYDSNGVPYKEFGVGTPGYNLSPYYVGDKIDP